MLKYLSVFALLAASTAMAEFSFEPRPIPPPPTPVPGSESVLFTASNHAVLSGEVSGPSVANAMVQLAGLKTNDPILFLDTPGGSIDSGMNLVTMIVNSRRPVTCVSYFAASMGFVITQACHKRYILMNSTLMQHQARFGVRGFEENFKTFSAYIFTMLNKMNTAQAKRMKISVEAFDKAREHDLWLYGEDAVKAGAADKVVSASCTEDLLIEKKLVTEMTMFGPIKLVFSKCPLITDPLDIEFLNVYDDAKKAKIYDAYMGAGASRKRDPLPLMRENGVKSDETSFPAPSMR